MNGSTRLTSRDQRIVELLGRVSRSGRSREPGGAVFLLGRTLPTARAGIAFGEDELPAVQHANPQQIGSPPIDEHRVQRPSLVQNPDDLERVDCLETLAPTHRHDMAFDQTRGVRDWRLPGAGARDSARRAKNQRRQR